MRRWLFFFFFFFNDTATTEIYTLSLHDALPILFSPPGRFLSPAADHICPGRDRKSTRLNSSHGSISYAVFCLKKKTHTATHQLLAAPLDHLTPSPHAADDA